MIKFIKDYLNEVINEMSGPEEASSHIFRGLCIVSMAAHIAFTILSGVGIWLAVTSMDSVSGAALMMVVSSPVILLSITSRMAFQRTIAKYKKAKFKEARGVK